MLVVPLMMAVFIPYAICNPLAEHSSRAVGSSSKAGLGWPTGVPWVDITQYQTTAKVSWFVLFTLIRNSSSRSSYRYYSWTPNSTDTSLEFVPMLWGASQVQQFSATINQTIANRNVSAVLAMNESVLRYAFSPFLTNRRPLQT